MGSGSLLTVTGPDGTIYNRASDTPDLLVIMARVSLRCVVVRNPQAGNWKAVISSQSRVPVSFVLNTTPTRNAAQTMMDTLAPVYYGTSRAGQHNRRSVVDPDGFDFPLAFTAVAAVAAVVATIGPMVITGSAVVAVGALAGLISVGSALASDFALYVKASNGVSVVPVTNQLIAKFVGTPATTVYVWSYFSGDHTREKAIGHAALHLSDGTHISWWPTSDGKPISLENMPNLPNVFKSPANQGQTFTADMALEKAEPDHRIVILGLDEEAIKKWWITFNTKDNEWSLLDQNCSTTVKDALLVGLAGRVQRLSPTDFIWVRHIRVWRPDMVVRLANKLAAFNPL